MLPSLFYSFYSDDETTGADISQKKPENAQGGINSATDITTDLKCGSITTKGDAARLFLMQGLDVGGIEPLHFVALTERLVTATSCTTGEYPLARAPAPHTPNTMAM